MCSYGDIYTAALGKRTKTQTWAKVPSQELSDALVEAFKDKLK